LNGAFNERGNKLRSLTPVEPRDVALRPLWTRTRSPLSDQAAYQRRGAADRGERSQAA